VNVKGVIDLGAGTDTLKLGNYSALQSGNITGAETVNFGAYSTAQVKNIEGVFEIYIGLNDIGQGSIASLSAIAADALDTGVEQVKIIMADTACTFDCGSTAASRSTFIGGNAIKKAAAEYRQRERNGETDIDVHVSIAFPESEKNVSVGVPHSMYTYVAQAVRVRTDPCTGETEILDAVCVTEAGRIINPMQFAGQMQGGMVQSMGFSLSEECITDSCGKITNPDFSTYIIPTMADAPHIEVYTVDSFEPSGPDGVKGAAESPTVPTAAAVNAAIHDAAGIWHFSLPMKPESSIKVRRQGL